MKKAYLQKMSMLLIYLIGFSTFPLLYLTCHSLKLEKLPEMLFWFFLQIASDYKSTTIYKSGNEVDQLTMSFVVQMSIAILLERGEALWIIMVATILVEIISRKPLYKVLFNSGQYGITFFTASTLFHQLKISPEDVILDIILDMPALVVFVIFYYLINTTLVSAAISLISNVNFFDVFFNDFKTVLVYFYSLVPISIAVSLLYDPQHPYIILIMIPPVLAADKALNRYYSLRNETRETLNVLADIIDERDEYTSCHSARVAEYAKRISTHMKLSSEMINNIETAGRVHDLGKVGINDKILQKPSDLTEKEYDKIKEHPEIAYRLLKNLTPYKDGAKYVLYHHERLDGKGYPKNISGNEIPLGAKILAVADSYDAMTTNRPYKNGLSQQEAVAELKRFSGSQFDPKVVNTFIDVLKSDYDYQEEK